MRARFRGWASHLLGRLGSAFASSRTFRMARNSGVVSPPSLLGTAHDVQPGFAVCDEARWGDPDQVFLLRTVQQASWEVLAV